MRPDSHDFQESTKSPTNMPPMSPMWQLTSPNSGNLKYKPHAGPFAQQPNQTFKELKSGQKPPLMSKPSTRAPTTNLVPGSDKAIRPSVSEAENQFKTQVSNLLETMNKDKVIDGLMRPSENSGLSRPNNPS